MPIVVVPARKSTRLTVAPPVADAVAVRVATAPSPRDAPAAGLVSETLGTEVATVTLTAVEVTTPELESVTRAVSETVPVAVGVQFTV